MLAGDCMRRLDPDLLQDGAEMWAKYSQLDMNIFRQYVEESLLKISFLKKTHIVASELPLK